MHLENEMISSELKIGSSVGPSLITPYNFVGSGGSHMIPLCPRAWH